MAFGKLFWMQMVVFILLAAAPPKIVDGTPQTMCDAAKNLGKTFSLCIFVLQSFQSVNALSHHRFSPNQIAHGGGCLLSKVI